MGPEPLQNLSLRPSLARFLMHLPEGHAGRIEHPFHVDFANLSPRTLKEAARGAKVTNSNLLYGLALHDTYHAGQIRLLKSMQKA